MNTAEQLRIQMANSDLFDKQKVLASTANGIREYGYCEIIAPYNTPDRIVYGDCHIEVATGRQMEAIAEYLKQEGFRIRPAYHPVSGRNYGYKATL